MSLSHHHTPITGNCVCRSEKSYKILYHRRYRRAVRMALRIGADPLPHFRELSNVWLFGKDGKRYIGNLRSDGYEIWKVFGK